MNARPYSRCLRCGELVEGGVDGTVRVLCDVCLLTATPRDLAEILNREIAIRRGAGLPPDVRPGLIVRVDPSSPSGSSVELDRSASGSTVAGIVIGLILAVAIWGIFFWVWSLLWGSA